MLYVISYAKGQPFEKYQVVNARTAKFVGRGDRVIPYSSGDIPEEYKKKHNDIFKYERGAGLWLWKPYLVNRTLDVMHDGDWLLYVDCASFFIRSIKPIIRFAKKKKLDIVLFGLPLLNRQFCKRECFVSLGLEDTGENQAVASFFLVKKTERTVSIMHEWLSWCEREDLISPNHFYDNILEFPDYCSHREDQSLLSLIAIKYNIPLNKDCSNYGEFPYDYLGSKQYEYTPPNYETVSYGVTIIQHRNNNPYKFFKWYVKKRIMRFLFNKYSEKEALKNVYGRL